MSYPASSFASGDYMQIGKYIGYAILIIVVIFVLEWFQIVDVPFFEIPDYLLGKKDMIHSTEDALEQMKWKVPTEKWKIDFWSLHFNAMKNLWYPKYQRWYHKSGVLVIFSSAVGCQFDSV